MDTDANRCRIELRNLRTDGWSKDAIEKGKKSAIDIVRNESTDWATFLGFYSGIDSSKEKCTELPLELKRMISKGYFVQGRCDIEILVDGELLKVSSDILKNFKGTTGLEAEFLTQLKSVLEKKLSQISEEKMGAILSFDFVEDNVGPL